MALAVVSHSQKLFVSHRLHIVRRELSSLQWISTAGVCGFIYTAIAIVYESTKVLRQKFATSVEVSEQKSASFLLARCSKSPGLSAALKLPRSSQHLRTQACWHQLRGESPHAGGRCAVSKWIPVLPADCVAPGREVGGRAPFQVRLPGAFRHPHHRFRL